jgi:hypothetical protein
VMFSIDSPAEPIGDLLHYERSPILIGYGKTKRK